jgi:hypothetical protein
MMQAEKLVPLPGLGRKYLGYLLGFIVTLGVGMAPLLGRRGVPGFTPLSDILPLNVKDGVIIIASVLITAPAIAVQFFSGDAFAGKRMSRLFGAVGIALVISTFMLYRTYAHDVVQIRYLGERGTVAYIVGKTMLPTCPCVAKNLTISACIGDAITTNPSAVTDCYDREEIADRETTFSMLYLFVMFCFGVLVGLVVVKEARPHPASRRRRPPGSEKDNGGQ